MMSLRLALLALVAVSARSALGDSSRNLQAAAAAAAASGGGPFGGSSSTSTAAVGGGNPFFWGRRLQDSNPEKNAAKVAKWTGEVRRWNEKIAAKVERRNEKTAAKIQKVNAKKRPRLPSCGQSTAWLFPPCESAKRRKQMFTLNEV